MATSDLPSSEPPMRHGVRGWFLALSPRDRVVYSVLTAFLLVIIGVYVMMGIGMLQESGVLNGDQTPVAMADTATVTPSTTVPITPTSTPPADIPTSSPTSSPTTIAPAPPVTPTATLTITQPPTATSGPGRTGSPIPAASPAGGKVPPPTTPPSTWAPPPPPTTALPPTAPPVVPPPQPTAPPEPTQRYLTLYFADPSGQLLVPVVRHSTVASQKVAETTLRELLAGPRQSLTRLVPPGVELLGLDLNDGLLTANFNQQPGDNQSIDSIALTLTEFPSISEVQLQVNGTNIGMDAEGGPIKRPILNPDNPQGLPTEYSSGTRFLPLYFVKDGYYVRITRLVNKTPQVAYETARELLAGPGSYSTILSRPIPEGTQVISVEKGDNQSAIVNLSAAFTNAANRQAALDTLVLSLTELRNTQKGGERYFERVQVLVEGRSLTDYWGGAYAGPFERPLLNPE